MHEPGYALGLPQGLGIEHAHEPEVVVVIDSERDTVGTKSKKILSLLIGSGGGANAAEDRGKPGAKRGVRGGVASDASMSASASTSVQEDGRAVTVAAGRDSFFADSLRLGLLGYGSESAASDHKDALALGEKGGGLGGSGSRRMSDSVGDNPSWRRGNNARGSELRGSTEGGGDGGGWDGGAIGGGRAPEHLLPLCDPALSVHPLRIRKVRRVGGWAGIFRSPRHPIPGRNARVDNLLVWTRTKNVVYDGHVLRKLWHQFLCGSRVSNHDTPVWLRNPRLWEASFLYIRASKILAGHRSAIHALPLVLIAWSWVYHEVFDFRGSRFSVEPFLYGPCLVRSRFCAVSWSWVGAQSHCGGKVHLYPGFQGLG